MPDKSEHIRGIALKLAAHLPRDTDDAVTSHRSHETAYQMAARQHHGDATTRLCGCKNDRRKLSALVPPSGFWIALSDLPANP